MLFLALSGAGFAFLLSDRPYLAKQWWFSRSSLLVYGSFGIVGTRFASRFAGAPSTPGSGLLPHRGKRRSPRPTNSDRSWQTRAATHSRWTACEVFAALALAAAAAFLISRFPDTRKAFGEDLDDGLYKGSLQGLWFFVALGAIVLLGLWLLL